MLKDVLTSSGLENWGLVGLIIFVVAFLAIIYLAWKMPKKKVDEFSRMPLEDDYREKKPDDTENKNVGD